MTPTQIGPVARQLQRMLGAHRARELSDAQLLQRFVASREEDAFTALLRRHGPLVLGVCRRVLRHEQDAEDAFQATFLTLARHAGSIRATEAVGSWLYRVAHRIASKAGVNMARRKTLEKKYPAADTAGSPDTESTLRELQGLLDDEVSRLPEKYRAPFVLCCLEGKTRSEAAKELSWKEGTVGGRLAMARQLLQKRLMRRGVTLSAALTALTVAATANAALSAGLIHQTAKAALLYAAGQGSGVSASVAVLLKGVSKTMWWTKVKIATVILATAAACGLAAMPPAKDETKPRAAAKPQAAKEEDSVTFAGRVLDPDDKPVAGAKVYVLYYTPKSVPIPVRAVSDNEGHFRFSVAKADLDKSGSPEPWKETMPVAAAAGYGISFPPMEPGKRWSLTDMTLRLVKDDVPLAGRVLDLQGKPVAGVTLTVQSLWTPRKGDLALFLQGLKDTKLFYPPLRDHLQGFEGGHISHMLTAILPQVVTDAEGRFQIKGIGRERLVQLRVEGPTIMTRIDYSVTRAADSILVPGRWGPKDTPEPITVHGVPFDHVAAPCKPIVGVVRDKDTGKPIPGAIVTSYQLAGSNHVDEHLGTVADAEGRFRLTGMPKAQGNIIKAAPADGQPYLMSLKKVDDTPGLEPVTADFNLKRGIWITGRVLDKATNKPVHSQVQYVVFDDNEFHKDVPGWTVDHYVATRADDGSFRFVGMPGRGLIGVRAWGDKYRQAVGVDKIAGLEENGHFRTRPYLLLPQNFHSLVEITPAKGAELFTCDITLDPGRTLVGKIVGPDGKPLAGALASGLGSNGYWEHQPLKTDEFTMTGLDADEKRLVMFFHKEKQLSGSVVLKGNQKEPPIVELRPSGTLTGRLVDADSKPVTDGELIALLSPPMATPGIPKVDLTVGSFPENRVRVGKDGSFRVEGLIPGLKYNMGLIKGVYLHKLGGEAGETLTIKAGETKKLGEVEVKPFE